MFTSKQKTTEYILAGNLTLSPRLLDDLSFSSEARIRARVAENPATPLLTLVRLLSDVDANVRLSLSHNPSLPRMFLGHLAVDADPDVRYGLAENPRLPQSVLEILAKDDNPYVSQRASRTLMRLRDEPNRRLVAQVVA